MVQISFTSSKGFHWRTIQDCGNSLFCQAERVLWKVHDKYSDLLAKDHFNLAFKFYEDLNVTKMLEDAGVSVGMDFYPSLIIQVIRQKTNKFANIKCYNGTWSGKFESASKKMECFRTRPPHNK
ncbi:unnamed protein product [Prunus armeniaca]|uniref:Uncharacterized protein n=1 Tax=Prunus armeniaca TaxID=36596 RepID=A0A6J5X003_PRUAR|nr:unnamed protein product [Prunus armeniaca]